MNTCAPTQPQGGSWRAQANGNGTADVSADAELVSHPKSKRSSETITRWLRSPLVDMIVGPHGIDRYLELIDPSLTVHDARAEIIAVRRQTGRSVTLTLKPNRAFEGFSAGQFVKLGVEIGAVRRTRTYSPAGPDQDGHLEITVTLRDNGLVSQYLIDNAKVGTVVHLSTAGMGTFTLPDTLPDRVALISGGSGITPVLSKLRTLLAAGYGGEITFVHFARTRDDQLYREELALLAERHPNLSVDYYATREGDEHFSERTLGDRWGAEASAAHIAVCGPPALIDAVTALYPETVSETFTPPSIGMGHDAAHGTLSFTRTGTEVPITTGTLLEQAEAAGLSPEFGCRLGICHSCTCRKSAGAVKNILTGEVTTEEDEDIQICVSIPAGDVALEL